MRTLFAFITSLIIVAFGWKAYNVSKETSPEKTTTRNLSRLSRSVKPDIAKIEFAVDELVGYAKKKRFDTSVFFVIDMSMPSGSKRFFVV